MFGAFWLKLLFCRFVCLDMVPGIRIVGSQVRDREVVLDGSFRPCPTAQAAGIPLVVRRDAFPGPESSLYLSVRFMTEPRLGFAPMDWQYGGIMGPAPAVVAARTDGVPFTPAGWEVLDDFIVAVFSGRSRLVNRGDMLRFLSEAQLALADVSESLALRYPKNAQVIPKGLTVAALNGRPLPRTTWVEGVEARELSVAETRDRSVPYVRRKVEHLWPFH
ncbi:unnamed protein product [Polarella glacialis]|uniref:Amine oxidase n=1 Tax=Polarella glacialis TaxID=89957 RepID=A0A813JJI2_POLGL|nr:unnamed protein product [Polarella glacialis]